MMMRSEQVWCLVVVRSFVPTLWFFSFSFRKINPRIVSLSPVFHAPPAPRRRAKRHAQALEPGGERADRLGRRDGGSGGLDDGRIKLRLSLFSLAAPRRRRHFFFCALASRERGELAWAQSSVVDGSKSGGRTRELDNAEERERVP